MANYKEYDDLFPRSVNDAVRNFRIREDFSLASALQEHEINKYYNENKYRNALMRIDYPKALDEQQKENENAKQEMKKKESLERQRERLDEELAMELANELRRERKLREEKKSGMNTNIPLEQHTPEKMIVHEPHKNIEFGKVKVTCNEGDLQEESAALQALRLLDCDSVAYSMKLEQELKDQELARKIEMLETSPILTQEEIDKKLAMEAQDEEVARMLYSREKAKLKKAREKARIKKEMSKQLHTEQSCHNNEALDNSSSLLYDDGEQKHNIVNAITEDIYVDPFDVKNFLYDQKSQNSKSTPENNKKYNDQRSISIEKNEEVPPYMPIQGNRRQPLEISKKKKDKCSQQ